MRNTSHRYYFEGTTTEEKMNRFDVPIHGLTEEYPDVFEQVKLAILHYKKGDFTIAARIWEDAADVGNDEAAYRLAKMLKETESFIRCNDWSDSEKANDFFEHCGTVILTTESIWNWQTCITVVERGNMPVLSVTC